MELEERAYLEDVFFSLISQDCWTYESRVVGYVGGFVCVEVVVRLKPLPLLPSSQIGQHTCFQFGLGRETAVLESIQRFSCLGQGSVYAIVD